ncbi:DUF748 domain-containing protein [Lentisalinibacter orientalis]|uniref:DUF748 domain-containing protein n=1 Tax=Lentisalinibacter orientalis TaxID=2992241 RepID=UPI003867FEA3
MSSAARKTLIAVAAIVVVIAAGLVYVYTQLDTIVAGLIEEQGSAATGTPVRVSGVSIDLGEARAEIAGLTVGNPEGYGGDAMSLGRFVIRIDPATVTENTIVLKEVTVSGATVNLIQRATGSNLRELMKTLESAGGGQHQADEAGPGRKLIIERFVLEDASASVSLPDLDEQRSVDIPRIQLTDIGRASGGATGTEVARQVLEPVIERVLQSAATESLKDRAKEKLDQFKEGLMNRLGGDEEESG